MTWDDYTIEFSAKAKKSRKTEDYIFRCLEYARPLFEKDLPVIFDTHHFSKLVGLRSEYIYYMSKLPHLFYRSFQIKKRNGGVRQIDEPLPDLKMVQRWILKEILEKINTSIYAKAFIKGSSIRDNAKFHRNQEVVLSVDIKNFFPSITHRSVFVAFREAGYSNLVATLLANLCCLHDCLPQGAPSSPQLSNVIFYNIDKAIGEYAKDNTLRYTRYADDITISGNVIVRDNLRFLNPLLYKKGFILNSDKTRVSKKNARQEVTGIVVNKYLQVPIELRKAVRQQMYYIGKYGVDSHLEKTGETRKNFISHQMGLIGHILFVNPKDEEMMKYYKYLQELNKDEYV